MCRAFQLFLFEIVSFEDSQRLHFWVRSNKKDAAICGVKKEILFSSSFFSGGKGLGIQFVAFAIEECQYYDYNVIGNAVFYCFRKFIIRCSGCFCACFQRFCQFRTSFICCYNVVDCEIVMHFIAFSIQFYADTPVSYTHLDVYKRQSYRRLSMTISKRRSLSVPEPSQKTIIWASVQRPFVMK